MQRACISAWWDGTMTPRRLPIAPFLPLVLGVVLLGFGVVALLAGAWGGYGRGGGAVLFVMTLGVVALVVGFVSWRPWFRYRASTTAQQRASHRAELAAAKRARRAERGAR